MKFLIAAVLLIILIAFSFQAYILVAERNVLKEKVGDLNFKIENLNKENENLKSDIEYFSRPENLEKELRARFNYRKQDEKMMIIVP